MGTPMTVAEMLETPGDAGDRLGLIELAFMS
jgi:hypothetical protein